MPAPLSEYIDIESSNIQFYSSTDFEIPTDADDLVTRARNGLRLLFMGWNSSWKQIVTKRLIKLFLWKRDSEGFAVVRGQFQEGFLNIYQQLKVGQFSEAQHRHVQLYLANIISQFPILDPSPFECLKIPQFINNEWVMVDYRIVPIDLTPQGVPKPFLKDADKVYAYGFEPINNNDAVSHLAFSGTSYPVGQGFGYQVFADLRAFETVGETLYRSGRENLNAWLEKQSGRDVHLTGASLGGSLSLLLAVDQPEKIKRVDAFNPAGLFPFRLRKPNPYDNWADAKKRPEVYVQKQDNDSVSKLGIWKPEWVILSVKAKQPYAGPKSAAHVVQYMGQPGVTVEQVDANEDNNQRYRKLRNIFVYTILRSVGYYLFIVPWIFVLRPIANVISKLFIKNDSLSVYSPHRASNQSMDIQQVHQEKNISFNDLAIYFHTQRCLLSQKQFIPKDDLKTNIRFINTDKKNVLKTIQDATNDRNKLQETITLIASDAKLCHIDDTLKAAKRNGITLFDQLKEKNSSQYESDAQLAKSQYYLIKNRPKSCNH